MSFPRLEECTRLTRLEPPTGPVPMVLDTDTYNEIDDQFALAYSLLSTERLSVEAVYAAPFHNPRSDGPEDGMEKSYEEILRILDRMDRSPDDFAFTGSRSYLPAADEPVASPAVDDLVERAMADRDGPLYVVPIGAITNIASAILTRPEIIDRIVVAWLGGQPHGWSTASEFNLKQDLHATRVILDSGVPFVHVPCKNVAEHITTTRAELDAHITGHNALGDYLFEVFDNFADNHYARAKVIWDLGPVAWLINADWVPTVITHAPLLTEMVTWSQDRSRHLMREAIGCNRNAIFADLFRKIAAFGD
ncbi:MAG: nucleoside hydrolase [Armatimonadota bacterium]